MQHKKTTKTDTRYAPDTAAIQQTSSQYDDPLYNYMGYWQKRGYEHRAEVMAVRNFLKDKHFHNAVDIGGGYGRLVPTITEFADTVTLVDPSRRQLDLAKDYLAEHPEVLRLHMQAAHMDFADESVDLVLMVRVLHHLTKPAPVFEEIARILDKDGYAIIELANSTHGRNRLRHILKAKRMPVEPVEVPSHSGVPREAKFAIPTVQHNPQTVMKELAHAGLKVERILSVSNLRNKGLEKIMPKSIMLVVEGILQPTLATKFFGPSVFFLVRKG